MKKYPFFLLGIGLLVLLLGIGSLLYWSFQPNPALSVSPLKDAISVEPTTPIRVTFIHPLSLLTFSPYSLILDPKPPEPYQYKKSGADSIEFTTQKPLEPGTFYKVSVYRGRERLYSWNFLTASLSKQEIDQQLEKQLPDEETVGSFFKGYYDEKSFIKNLPINTDDFLIVYSSESSSIIVGIKHPENSSSLEEYKQKAIELLAAATVNVQTEKIEWKFLKKN